MRKGGNTNKNLSVEKRYNFKNHCPCGFAPVEAVLFKVSEVVLLLT